MDKAILSKSGQHTNYLQILTASSKVDDWWKDALRWFLHIDLQAGKLMTFTL